MSLTFNLAVPKKPTPLMLAVLERKIELVRIFLGNGVNPNVTTENGATALHYAAALGIYEAVRLLLRFGADTTLKLNTGETAEDLSRINEHAEIAELFDMTHARYRPHFFKTVTYSPSYQSRLLRVADEDESAVKQPFKPTSAA